MAEVIVIGAGVAGCLGARELEAAGHDVTVLDKGFVPGGRLSSRNIGGATFDTGAQFLTARSDAFRDRVESWRRAGVAQTWFHGSPDLDAPSDPAGHPRFRGAPTMRRLAEHLAAGLHLRTGTIVGAVEQADGHLRVHTAPRAEGASSRAVWPPGDLEAVADARRSTRELPAAPQIAVLQADAVLLTAPIPQSLDILAAGRTALSRTAEERLQSTVYAPTIAVLAVPDGPTGLPVRGAARIPGGDIEWVTDNLVTGASTEPAITIHTGADFSAAHLDAGDDEISAAVLVASRDLLGPGARVVHVHRWRFAKPVTDPGTDHLLELIAGTPLALAGDAFGGGRVEGAALSGMAGAQALVAALRDRAS